MSPASARAGWVGCDALGRLHVVGVDDRRLAVRRVLLDDERVRGLATRVRRERQLASRQDRLDLQAGQRVADLLLVDRAGLRDRLEERPRGLVADRLVPLRVLPELRLELLDERLVEALVAELSVPPDRGDDVA